MPRAKCRNCGKPLGGTDGLCYTCQTELVDDVDDPDPCPACGSDRVEAVWLSKPHIYRLECRDCGYRAQLTADREVG